MAQQLFPTLPPELRNMIYASSLTFNPPTNQHLPFQQKTYTSSHTTVHLIPTYHGTPSLISLQHQNYLEAHEYLSYILDSSAVSLHIAVHFQGNAQTFSQADWDAKHIAHLRTLLRNFPWLGRVRDYDVQILWEPRALPHGVKPRVRAGAVAGRMAEVLTSTLRTGGGKKGGGGGGVVNVGLHIADYIAIQHVASHTPLGLSHFLSPLSKSTTTTTTTTTPDSSSPFPLHTLEIRIVPRTIPSTTPSPTLPTGFKTLPIPPSSTKPLLVQSPDGTVHWTAWLCGAPVHRRTVEKRGDAVVVRCGAEEKACAESWRFLQTVYLALAGECGEV